MLFAKSGTVLSVDVWDAEDLKKEMEIKQDYGLVYVYNICGNRYTIDDEYRVAFMPRDDTPISRPILLFEIIEKLDKYFELVYID